MKCKTQTWKIWISLQWSTLVHYDVILMLTISGMVTEDDHFAFNFCSALTFGPTEADGDFCLEQQRGCGCGRGWITLDSSCLQQVCPHIVLYATPCFNHFSPSQYFYMLHTSVASSLEEAWNCKFVLDEGGNVIDHAGMEMCLSITTVWRKLMRARPKT